MYKILLSIVLLHCCILGYGQDKYLPSNKGTILLGTELGFSTASGVIDINGIRDEKTSETIFSIAPFYGYFFTPRFVTGLEMQYDLNRIKVNGVKDVESNSLFGVFARYYLFLNNSQAVFLNTNYRLNGSRENVTNGASNYRGSKFSDQFGIGIGYSIISHDGYFPIGLEVKGEYNFGRTKNNFETNGQIMELSKKVNQFNLSVALSFYFNTKNDKNNDERYNIDF